METNKYVAELLGEHAINKDGFKEYMTKQKKNVPPDNQTVPAAQEQKK